jgi:Uncharacterised nucleotidyltransferase
MSVNNKSIAGETGPEAELLLCCGRRFVDRERAERIKVLLRQPLDWEYLLDMAFRHALAPLLYHHLHAVDAEAIPESHMSRLQGEFHRNAAHNILLTRELCRILEVFEENNIPVIPYKGPVLALTAYGDTALRQFSDLDLLIRERDVSQAARLLLSIGYQSVYRMTNPSEAAYVHSQREQAFSRGTFCVEIHWAFAPEYLSTTFDDEAFWNRLEKIELGGRIASTLSVEDLLLVLCTHAGKHQWERLAWACDVAEVINGEANIDWGWLIEMADKARTRRMLYLGLFLANDLLGARIPKEILQNIRADPAVEPLANEVRARVFSPKFSSLTPSEVLRFHYRVRERARDGIRYCYYLTVPPTPAELASINVPDSLHFLYYLVRPVRLIKKHATGYAKRLQRRSPNQD